MLVEMQKDVDELGDVHSGSDDTRRL
jgi:hypothetical protein